MKTIPVIIGELPLVSERRLLEVKELLTQEEAAAILRCTTRKIRYMVHYGHLQGVQVHSSLRIRTASVKAILEGGGK